MNRPAPNGLYAVSSPSGLGAPQGPNGTQVILLLVTIPVGHSLGPGGSMGLPQLSKVRSKKPDMMNLIFIFLIGILNHIM